MNSNTNTNKRQHLIHTALTLFYQNGIHAVGINEVIKASGIAKKTLYHHFNSKDELILATLIERNGIFLNWLENRLKPLSTDKAVAQEVFHALSDWFNNGVAELMPFRGCFFINSAAEYDEQNNPISQYCQQHKQQVRHLIEQQMTNATAEFIDLICFLKEGAIVTAHVNKDLKAADKCQPLILRYLE